jgi:hypothetical protein
MFRDGAGRRVNHIELFVGKNNGSLAWDHPRHEEALRHEGGCKQQNDEDPHPRSHTTVLLLLFLRLWFWQLSLATPTDNLVLGIPGLAIRTFHSAISSTILGERHRSIGGRWKPTSIVKLELMHFATILFCV